MAPKSPKRRPLKVQAKPVVTRREEREERRRRHDEERDADDDSSEDETEEKSSLADRDWDHPPSNFFQTEYYR